MEAKCCIQHCDHIAYADDVDTGKVLALDANAIGLTWRRFIKFGLLKRTGKYRKSKNKSRRGGIVFQYRVVSVAKLKTFLERNGWTKGLMADEQMPLL